MKICKKYHFYAAHRNELLIKDKCSRLHGHQYNMELDFDVTNIGAAGVTTLFSDFDNSMSRLLANLDHRTLVHKKDAVLMALPQDWLFVLPFPTSAENMALCLFAIIEHFTHFTVAEMRLQETASSSVVIDAATYEHWLADESVVTNLGSVLRQIIP